GEDGANIRLVQVRAHAGHVADVVTHVVRDDRRIARVVLGNPGFHFADQVGTHVGRLRVNAAAHTGKEGDGARAQSEAVDDVERVRIAGVAEQQHHDGQAGQPQPDD